MAVDKIAQYLTGISYGEAGKGVSPPPSYPFIAVSRQAGCGAHALAEAVLEEMEKRSEDPVFGGWQIFDEEICRRVGENPKLKVLMEELLAEKFKGGVEDVFTHLVAGASYQDAVTREIFRTVRAAALLGKSIIIGRGAASLLRRHPLGVFVRLVAPLGQRIASLGKGLGVGKEEAARLVAERDADRARFVRRYFGQDIDDPLLYDCVWNVGRAPVEVLAKVAVDLVKLRCRLSGVLPGR